MKNKLAVFLKKASGLFEQFHGFFLDVTSNTLLSTCLQPFPLSNGKDGVSSVQSVPKAEGPGVGGQIFKFNAMCRRWSSSHFLTIQQVLPFLHQFKLPPPAQSHMLMP